MHNEKPHLPSKSLNSHVAAILVLLSSTFHLPPSTCFFFMSICVLYRCVNTIKVVIKFVHCLGLGIANSKLVINHLIAAALRMVSSSTIAQ